MLAADLPAAGRHVELPRGVSWPNLHSPVLFMRHFYEPLYSGVLNELRASGSVLTGDGVPMGKAIICGTPGIGKSSFGLYALFRAIRAGRPAVYASAKLTHCFLFDAGRVSAATGLRALADALDAPEAVLVADGATPHTCAAFTILVASPRRDRWHAFYKEPDCEMFHLPVFSFDELEQMRRACFPAVPHAKLAANFERWGGVPRYCLAKLSATSQAQLEEAAEACTLDRLLDHGAALDMAHALLHIKTRGELEPSLDPRAPEYYARSRAELASRHVAALVYGAAMRSRHERLFDFLHGSAGNPAVAVVRGQLLEQEQALLQAPRGGGFAARRLGTAAACAAPPER